MHQGGRIARTVRAHLAAHPDDAFTTDDLCRLCYPEAAVIERKHRVSVLRAASAVLSSLPDWRAAQWGGTQQHFYNAASVASTSKTRYRDPERRVADYLTMRDGTPEQRHRVIERREAEHELQMAQMRYTAAVAKNPLGIMLAQSRAASADLAALAELARTLLRENDPDAVRDGLRRLADALDAIARTSADPLTTIMPRCLTDRHPRQQPADAATPLPPAGRAPPRAPPPRSTPWTGFTPAARAGHQG